MSDLVDSFREHGVLVPALVRPKEDGTYEMVSGHRRKFASGLAELGEILCIIRDLPDDEAMKRQGQRSDLTSVPVAQKSHGKTSRQLLGEQVGESQDQIRRYIRLTELIQAILVELYYPDDYVCF